MRFTEYKKFELTLIFDLKMRSNSLLNMIARCMEIRRAINQTLTELNLEQLRLVENENFVANDLVESLKIEEVDATVYRLQDMKILKSENLFKYLLRKLCQEKRKIVKDFLA